MLEVKETKEFKGRGMQAGVREGTPVNNSKSEVAWHPFVTKVAAVRIVTVGATATLMDLFLHSFA